MGCTPFVVNDFSLTKSCDGFDTYATTELSRVFLRRLKMTRKLGLTFVGAEVEELDENT